MIAVVHSFPTPVSTTTNLNPTLMVTTAVTQKQLTVNVEVLQYPFPSNDWRNLVHGITSVLHSFSISETLALAESIRRRMIPHIAETLTLSESIRRKMIPKVAGETLHLAESILRKMIPHIAETLTLAETIKKKVFKPITESLHLTETDTRKMIPHITGETLHLSESIRRRMIPHIAETLTLAESVKKKVFKTISETLHLAEAITRKMMPHITGETIHLSESFLRKIIPHIAETLTLSESVKKKVVKLIPAFLLYDDFESGTYTYSAEPQASPNNLWTVQFRGGGTAGVHTPSSSTDTTLVDFQTPQVATSSGQTFSSLVTSNSSYTDFTLEFDVRTIAQIRTGSAPNNWEVAWIFWHWTDNNHQYYFTPKMSGTELGKKDTGGTQIILATTGSGDFTLTLGQWYHVKIITVGNHFKAYINGTLHIDYVDTGVGGFPSASNFAPTSALYSGKVGMYCEDSQVEFDNVSITPTEGFFLKEPAPLQFPIKLIPHIAGETLHLSESILRKMIPKISETLHLSESILRKMIPKIAGEILHLVESISAIKIPGGKFISETLHLAESEVRKMIPRIGCQLYRVTVAESLTLSESVLRKPRPNIVESLHLAENIIRKPIPHIAETLHLAETITRKMKPHIVETLTLNDIIKIGGQFVIMIHETLSLSESVLRKQKPHITGETLHLSESFLRKIPHNFAETLTLSESTRKKVIKPIVEAVNITECHVHNIVGHGMHVFQFIFHDKWRDNPPKRYTINVEESIKLEEKVESDTSGPSYLWKFAPLWKAMGRTKR